MSEQQNKGNIILYQTPDGQAKIEVTLGTSPLFHAIYEMYLKRVNYKQIQLLRFLQQFKMKESAKWKEI